MENSIQDIKVEKSLTSCPSCNYKDGFHIGFLTMGNSELNEIILICPNCHERFKIGWGIKLNS